MATADFDTAALAAVTDYFGATPSVKEKDENQFLQRSVQKGRKGVGASDAKPSVSTSLSTKKLMRVGKRKRGEIEDAEDDESQTVEEEEEEEGRTAIKDKVGPRTQKAPLVNSLTNATEHRTLSSDKMKNKAEGISTTGEPETEELADTTAAANDKKKRRRRKIRSRQKNIRKDSRADHNKPEHLRIGSRKYQGRPMTAETRSKLNLPARKPTSSTSIEVYDPTPKATGSTELAIDDLLKEDNDETGEPQPTTKAQKQKKKTRRKSKYKNL